MQSGAGVPRMRSNPRGSVWMTGEANISEEQHSVVAYEVGAKLKEKNT
jgi:hypothetical protein